MYQIIQIYFQAAGYVCHDSTQATTTEYYSELLNIYIFN